MSKALSGISPIICIDRGIPKPLNTQIYDAFRAAILRGDLSAGQQIPSSRKLASEIQVSRFPSFTPTRSSLLRGISRAVWVQGHLYRVRCRNN